MTSFKVRQNPQAMEKNKNDYNLHILYITEALKELHKENNSHSGAPKCDSFT